MAIKVVSTEKAPQAIGPYSQGIIAGDMVYTSGQLGIDPSNGEIVSSSIQEEARQSLKNVEAVLKEAGAVLSDVIKTTVKDPQELEAFINNNIWSGTNKIVYENYVNKFKKGDQIAIYRRKDNLIEIEAIAVKK